MGEEWGVYMIKIYLQLDMPCFDWYAWKASPFLKEKERRVDFGEKGGGLGGGLGGEEEGETSVRF